MGKKITPEEYGKQLVEASTCSIKTSLELWRNDQKYSYLRTPRDFAKLIDDLFTTDRETVASEVFQLCVVSGIDILPYVKHIPRKFDGYGGPALPFEKLNYKVVLHGVDEIFTDMFQYSDIHEVVSTTFGSVGPQSFQGCNELTSAVLPACKEIKEYAFFECENLKYLNIPNCESIREDAFGVCNSLVEVNLPKVEHLDTYAFSHCMNLKEVYLPNLKSVSNRGDVLSGCHSIQKIHIPKDFADKFSSKVLLGMFVSSLVGSRSDEMIEDMFELV